jgi:hypothetical protein
MGLEKASDHKARWSETKSSVSSSGAPGSGWEIPATERRAGRVANQHKARGVDIRLFTEGDFYTVPNWQWDNKILFN